MTVPVLDDFELDLDCYKIRLAMSVLRIEYSKRPVDVHPAPPGIAPVVPVLRHGDHVVHGPENVLRHLATELVSDTDWAPDTDELRRWLAFAAGPFTAVTAARDLALYRTDPIDDAVARAAAVIGRLDDHLALQRITDQWVAGPHPTIADLALFAGAALTRDIGIDRGTYPALRWWLRRVQALPGFIAMPGIPVFP